MRSWQFGSVNDIVGERTSSERVRGLRIIPLFLINGIILIEILKSIKRESDGTCLCH